MKVALLRVAGVLGLSAGSLIMPLCLAQGNGAPAPAPASPQSSQQSGRGQNQARTPALSDVLNRPLFLAGSVRVDDGTTPPSGVVIERVCGGLVRRETSTDSNGDFSFLLSGQESAMMADASVQGAQLPRGGNSENLPGTLGNHQLAGCELRASLAGFVSNSIVLGFRQPLDDPRVGTIQLHRLDPGGGPTVNVTAEAAPKDARKAYEKGVDSARKQKWAQAEIELLKAVMLFPEYVVAWHELGRVYEMEKKAADAERAYQEAIRLDPRFFAAYGQLTRMAIGVKNWEGAASSAGRMIKLNPFVAAEFYFYSAVANFNLHNLDSAEEHAREAARLDVQHRTPKINHLFGVILAQKEKYAEAAEQLRTYIELSPEAADLESVKRSLNAVEDARRSALQ